ncbi:hypothetical protein REPUB_Repub05bG0184100 [Reevesia pubescens]
MECALFPPPLFPHIFINSRFPTCFAFRRGEEIKLYRKRWLNSTCCAVGVSEIGAGNLFDDSSSNGAENRSLMSQLQHHFEHWLLKLPQKPLIFLLVMLRVILTALLRDSLRLSRH